MSNTVNISFARRALPVNLEAMKLVSNVTVTLTPENVDLSMWQPFFFQRVGVRLIEQYGYTKKCFQQYGKAYTNGKFKICIVIEICGWVGISVPHL